MEKRRPGQGGRGKPAGTRRPKSDDKGKPGRTERPERRDNPSTKPRAERKPRPESSERPERRDKPGTKPWAERKPRPEGSERPERRDNPSTKPRAERKPRPEGSERPERRDNPSTKLRAERKPRPEGSERPERPERPERRGKPNERPSGPRPRLEKSERPERPERRGRPETKPWEERKTKDFSKPNSRKKSSSKEELVRLNKYIANAGICSRREADKLIVAGVVRVNGKVVTELGMKVSPADRVQYEEQTINKERARYILLNKPKGYITTVDDPEKRKTVMLLIEGACKERVYPVGRLDRNTTGLLLFTNDGMIAKKLTHPKYGVKKIYHVELDRSLSKGDLEKIRAGLELDDGRVEVDEIEYSEDSKSKKELGVELHSGKNRVIRRIFEHLDYKIVKLDRVYYAGLTKKNLPRGHWRILEEHEINLLKMSNS